MNLVLLEKMYENADSLYSKVYILAAIEKYKKKIKQEEAEYKRKRELEKIKKAGKIYMQGSYREIVEVLDFPKIKIHKSINEASKESGISYSKIAKCCEQKITIQDHQFMFKEDYIKKLASSLEWQL